MRYRRILIHGQLLVGIFTEGNITSAVKCIQGLPSDTKFCYAIPSQAYGIELVAESREFDLLKDGDEIPKHPEIQLEQASQQEYEAYMSGVFSRLREMGIK